MSVTLSENYFLLWSKFPHILHYPNVLHGPLEKSLLLTTNATGCLLYTSYDINVKYEVIPDAQFTNLSQVRLSTGEVLSGVMAVGYNKTVFKKLGIEIPKTYDDFRKALDTVKNSGKDITPISCL